MTVPGFTAGASLYLSSRRYGYARSSIGNIVSASVLAQQLCGHLGQSCGGIDLVCCRGLRCTAGLGGRGICVPDAGFHCSPCKYGWQICCPPRGFGLACFRRRC